MVCCCQVVVQGVTPCSWELSSFNCSLGGEVLPNQLPGLPPLSNEISKTNRPPDQLREEGPSKSGLDRFGSFLAASCLQNRTALFPVLRCGQSFSIRNEVEASRVTPKSAQRKKEIQSLFGAVNILLAPE